jgi:hypothetical protein
MQTDRQADMTKLVVGFRNFAKTHKTIIAENIHPRLTRNTQISKAFATQVLYPNELNSHKCEEVFPGT